MEKRTRFSIQYFLVVLLGILFLDTFLFSGSPVEEISYKAFRDLLAQGRLETVVITPHKIYGRVKADDSDIATTVHGPLRLESKETPWRLHWEEVRRDLARQFMVTPLEDPDLISDLQAHGVDYRGVLQDNRLADFFFNWIIPFGIMLFIWGVIFNRMGAGPGGALSLGRNRAKIYAEDPKNRVTFRDVAGIDEAVEEVREVVEFLKNPRKFTDLGAKLPKGVLLVGPPGTGKTLLARAVAGEAGVPFFNIGGSEFVEMFVGVGAARVRDLFAQAKEKAPCIIFIDEIDAIGKSRGGGALVGGYDERENTLNQLLTEMDGFDPRVGIMIIAATNRADVLDPALLRPGRFDRQILVDRPDRKGRRDIFMVHTRGLRLAGDVDLDRLAAQTPGFAGAEIANVCNEAALLAARHGRELVTASDFQEAVERIVAGLEKRNRLIHPEERRIVAYHESGHALAAYFTPGADPVHKVSIVPRGFGALGYTLQTPLEDRYLLSRRELLDKIRILLAGRAAEEIVFGEISTGAANDLEQAARIAGEMVERYGMSRRLPHMSFVESSEGGFLHPATAARPRSPKTAELIDTEIREWIGEGYLAAKTLLNDRREQLTALAEALLQKEVLSGKDVEDILGPRPPRGDSC